MKIISILSIVAMSMAFCTANAADSLLVKQQTLTIESGTVSVKIIEGTSFVFPKNLASYGISLTQTPQGYSIKEIANSGKGKTKITSSHGNNVTSIQGNGNTINSVQTNSDGQSNTTVIVNGKVITNGSEVPKPVKLLIITVPKLINLKIKANYSNIEIDGAINKLIINASQVGTVTVVGFVNELSSLIISGASKVIVQNAQSVGAVVVSGAGNLSMKTKLIQSISVSGAGYAKISGHPAVYNQTISDNGSLNID